MEVLAQSRRKSGAWIATMVVAVVVLMVVGGLAVPWPLGGYPSSPHPGFDYAQAVQLAQGLDACPVGRVGCASASMNPLCQVQLLTHGSKTERVIVLIHGYTACPEQFRPLGTQLYDRGYNVLIAPLPYHGLAERMTDEISRLTAADLTGYADRIVDIAHGLGDEVDVAGLSAGGVIAAWVAQNRSDVNLAVVISPAFGFKQIPTPLTLPVMNTISIMPESYTWWDPRLQMDVEPSYDYPRYSMHGLMQVARLGFAVNASAARAQPATAKILVVTNGNEPAVNNDLTAEWVCSLRLTSQGCAAAAGSRPARWQAHGVPSPLGAGMGPLGSKGSSLRFDDAGVRPARPKVATYEFPASLGLPHDLIDPNQPEQQVDLVYPVLIELIEKYR